MHALSKTFRRMANLPRSNVAEGPKEGFIRFDMSATKTPTRLALRPSPIREMRPTQAEELRRRVLVGVGVLYVCGGVAADNVDSCDSPDCDAVRASPGRGTTGASWRYPLHGQSSPVLLSCTCQKGTAIIVISGTSVCRGR